MLQINLIRGYLLMKKRLLSLLLVAVMAVSLCACGSAATEDKEANASGRVPVENYVPTYPIVEEPITITALVVGEDTSAMKTRILWDEVEALTNIHIEWDHIDGDAFSTRLASGNWPDIIMASIGQTGMYDYGVLGGKIVNYLDYLDIMPNLRKTLEDYPATLAYATQLDGKVYNLFRISGVHPTSCSCRPHYRVDVLKAAGVEKEPTTIEEFYDALVKCKEYYGEASFIHEKNITSSYAQSLFGAFGDLTQLDYSDDGTGKLVFPRTTEQYKEFVKFMHKLYEEELMHKEYLTLDAAAALKLVQGGKIAFFTQAAAQKLTLEDLNGDWNNLGTLQPFASAVDPTPELHAYADYNADCGMHINVDSPYIEEICKMLDIAFASEEVVEGSNLYGTNFAHGPEHTTWTDNGDGTFSEFAPEGYSSKSVYISQYYHWSDSVGRNDAIAGMVTSTPGNTQMRQKGYMEKIIPFMNDTVVSIKHLKFTEDEQYVIDNKYGEIKAYYDQMEAEFISGAKDIDTEWDNFVTTLDQMGIAEVTEVMQASYDRFLEAKAAIAAPAAE